ANFGAEVIRLESRVAADVFRTTYPPFKDGIVAPDRAAMFAFYNDGKRSATLNLKHAKGVALARALIGTADVFVESFTPGTVARRKRTGAGCTIDLSQYEAGLQFLTPTILEFAANGRIPGRAGNADAIAAPHGVYRCAGPDRWIALSVWTEEEWRVFRELTGIVGAPTAAGRRNARRGLDERIGAWTATRDRDEVVRLLRRTGLRAAPVLAISELFTDPQLAHRGMWPTVTHPTIGEMHLMAPPFRLSATPSRQDRPGPTVGADNDHVFGEILGLSPDERRRLERD